VVNANVNRLSSPPVGAQNSLPRNGASKSSGSNPLGGPPPLPAPSASPLLPAYMVPPPELLKPRVKAAIVVDVVLPGAA